MKRRSLPLTALRAFEAAGRLGRMTAAANELSVTPGAISRQVRELEIALGTPLFEGSKANPELTASAKMLLPALSAAFDQIDSAVSALIDDGRTLDVCCFSTFTAKWLIPRLHHFNLTHPGIDIRMSTSTFERNADIDRERYDLIVTVEGEDNALQANAFVLFPERLGPVLAPSLASQFPLRKPEDVINGVALHTRTRMNAWQMWGQSVGRDLPAMPGPQFDHYYFTLEAAIAGLGICIAPWHLVIEEIRAGRLLAPLGFHESGCYYVAKHGRRQSRCLEQFCHWLSAQARATPTPDVLSM